jgi:hypothetical protein
MRRINNLILVFLLTVSFSGIAIAKEWRGIVPLHSTRNDVEKLFGLSAYGGGYAYEFENERVFFHYQYADKPCEKDLRGWEVPLNTVLAITVYPKNKTLFVKLGLDLNNYAVKPPTCLPGIYNYHNIEEGIGYSVNNEVVDIISYVPSAKDKSLSCFGLIN